MYAGIMIASAALTAVLVARCAARQTHPLRALLASVVGGLAALGAVAALSAFTGVELPINRFTCFFSSVLGMPGVILLLLLSVIL